MYVLTFTDNLYLNVEKSFHFTIPYGTYCEPNLVLKGDDVSTFFTVFESLQNASTYNAPCGKNHKKTVHKCLG